jgi:hypothetical protein
VVVELKLLLLGGAMILCSAWGAMVSHASESATDYSVGAGSGRHYGGFAGVNVEKSLIGELGASAAVGYIGHERIGWELGAQYWVRVHGDRWYLRLSALYGTQGRLFDTTPTGDEFARLYEGFGAGAGIAFWISGDWKIVGDLWVPLTDTPDGYEPVERTVYPSWGLAYLF